MKQLLPCYVTFYNKTVLHYNVKVIVFITVFTVFRLLTDFVCLYNYEFGLSLCKIVRSSVILLLPLFTNFLPIVGGSLKVLQLLPHLRMVAMI
jgi:hypothetical protein